MDPWMTTPIASTCNLSPASLPVLSSTPSPSNMAAYTTFFSAPGLNAPPAVNTTFHNLFGGIGRMDGLSRMEGISRMDDTDPRNSSIVSLRMRAKEHMEHLERKYQLWWLRWQDYLMCTHVFAQKYITEIVYSRPTLSGLHLSQIASHHEVKLLSLFKHENLTTGKNYCGKEEKLLSFFPQ